MAMHIRNWSKFQHFKDRRPPWVKLYRDVLDDLDWHRLDGDSAKTLVMLWLLASEGEDGELPPVDEIAFRLRITEKQAKTTISKLSKWLEQSDITAISPRYQLGPSETETETEGETEAEARKRAAFKPPTVEQVSEYTRSRGSPVDPEAFVAYYASKGWKVGNTAMKNWKAAIVTWEKRENEKRNGTAGKPVWESPADRRRQLDEALARAEGAAGVEANDGNVRGQVLEGVWSRAE